MKLFFYDLETTGVKFWKNGIHQISGMIVIDGVKKESFNFKVKPHIKAAIEPEALKIARITEDDLKNHDEMSDVYIQIINILDKYADRYDKKDKFHLCGYNNAAFDNQFFRAFFVQNNDSYFGSWFWPDSLDCYVLASNHLKKVRHTMPNFKQMTVAKQLGIPVDEEKLHDAEYDIELCYQIYKIVS